jgi:superfamily I DNA/RNA helicase
LIGDVTQQQSRSGEALPRLGINLCMRPPLLRTNMRSSRQICEASLKILENSRFEELDGSGAVPAVLPEVHALGTPPVLKFHENEEEEIIWLLEMIEDLIGESYGYQYGDIAILARSNRYLTLLEVNLNGSQIPVQNFKKAGTDRVTNKVKICNYPECKGMEFPVVILTEVVEGILPEIPAGIDSEELTAHLTREKCLLNWGIHRAKDILFISGAQGEPSRFLAPLMESAPAAHELEAP